MTSKSPLKGIDVSHYQGAVDWSAVRNAGISFAFAKASDGNTYVDPQFRTNWQAMKVAGVVRGAYHFYETKDDPLTQANNFIEALDSLDSDDLPPVVDIECYNGAFGTTSLASNLHSWLDTVSKAFGRTPVIYTGSSFWNTYLGSVDFSAYPLWIAEYDVSQPKIPNGWSNWTFWQSSQSGSVAGVSGAVDLDQFAGSSMAELSVLFGA
ncbi:glycoside hydrolase family 25 protein [Undibacterium sp. Rencai35W]|uniref:glycoside hydrolase family 25 protein n=1 Tax=Undibacterium sp. Rencai35W TaxID=3413046 RepID=UPI003BEFED73